MFNDKQQSFGGVFCHHLQDQQVQETFWTYPADAGSSFFNVSKHSQILYGIAKSEDVNLNINFVWLCLVWWNLKEEAVDHTQWRNRF
jgi:hypothetical protein